MTAAARATRITSAVAARPRLWWAVTLGFPAVYHLMMFAALVARFQAWPNYAVTYDWLGNVTEIIRATPSLSDMGAIIAQEWLFEVGRMNYDYGNGISEWSLHINPAKVLIICLLGGLVATLTTLVAAHNARRPVWAAPGPPAAWGRPWSA